tara:strand:+ start:190 stop:696 length:507 start_codon:yes stop_codon:yes gene_type:complete
MNFTSIVNSKDPVEPDTIRALTDLTDEEIQKAMVLWTIKNTRAVYEDMDVFENTVLVLNGINPDVTKMEGVEPEHIWYALGIMQKYNKDREFSHEVQMYIKYIFNDAGCWFYPESAGIENNTLSHIQALADRGPFPLKEDYTGVQAYKLLKINNYIEEKEHASQTIYG